MGKPTYGVIVGRFQVNDLHEGHKDLFDQVLARHNRVIVFIGCDPAGLSKNHPLDYTTREVMIRSHYPMEQYPGLTIHPLEDLRTDEEWSAQLDKKIDEIVKFGDVTLYGGRDSFVPHYKGKHAPIELALNVRKHKISGTEIREKYSETIIASPDFRAGMIYAAAQKWPEILPCVDVAILSYDRTEVCLGRREYEKQWRFIGGHAEKKHGQTNPYEHGARAESMEEAGADLIDLEYVGSAIVNDWRVRSAPDKTVMTSFYAGRVSNMGLRAGDDIHEIRWFKLSEITEHLLVPEHAMLAVMLLNYLDAKREAQLAHTV